MTKTLTFQEFQATRTLCEDLIELVSEHGYRGYTYADRTCFINLDEDRPSLVIHNMHWSEETLEVLEKILYEQYYLPEVEGVEG